MKNSYKSVAIIFVVFCCFFPPSNSLFKRIAHFVHWALIACNYISFAVFKKMWFYKTTYWKYVKKAKNEKKRKKKSNRRTHNKPTAHDIDIDGTTIALAAANQGTKMKTFLNALWMLWTLQRYDNKCIYSKVFMFT